MTTPAILAQICERLEAAGIPYMVTGSVASSLHGRPRATHDLDVVIAPTAAQLQAFIRALPRKAFYVSDEAASSAYLDGGMFNVVDFASGWKVGLIMRKNRPFSREEFDRRTRVHIGETTLWLATAEDVVLAKLEWAKNAESTRQLEDCAGIVRTLGEDFDQAYLAKWIGELGVSEQWAAVLRMAT